jgi:hypothetical protein
MLPDADFTKAEEVLSFIGSYTKNYVTQNPEATPEHAKAVAQLCKTALEAHYVLLAKVDSKAMPAGWRMAFGKAM